jgi:hypothetical protein
MPTGNLRTRIEKLEGRAATTASVCSFDARLIALSTKISTPLAQLRAAIESHNLHAYLDCEMDDSGLITWSGFCALRSAILDDFGPAADIYVSMPSVPAIPATAEARHFR